MQIIGIGRYSRVGKDTLAKMIVRECREMGLTAKRISLAWKLKQITYDLYSWAGMREPEFYDTEEGEKYRDIVLEVLGMTPVEIWVAFGTPAVRNQVYDRTWIDYVLRTDHKVDVLVVPDIRFPNETEAFHGDGAKLIKVIRPGYGPRNTVADMALAGWDGWDLWVGNESLNHMRQTAKQIADFCGDHCPWPIQSKSEVRRIKEMEVI